MPGAVQLPFSSVACRRYPQRLHEWLRPPATHQVRWADVASAHRRGPALSAESTSIACSMVSRRRRPATSFRHDPGWQPMLDPPPGLIDRRGPKPVTRRLADAFLVDSSDRSAITATKCPARQTRVFLLARAHLLVATASHMQAGSKVGCPCSRTGRINET